MSVASRIKKNYSRSQIALCSGNLADGKYGYFLGTFTQDTAASVAWARAAGAASLGASLAALPVALTEHNAHTTAEWNALSSTADAAYEASRVAAQLLSVASRGVESFVFKLSALEQSTAITAGCTRYLTPDKARRVSFSGGFPVMFEH